jgi:hypothetical protein
LSGLEEISCLTYNSDKEQNGEERRDMRDFLLLVVLGTVVYGPVGCASSNSAARDSALRERYLSKGTWEVSVGGAAGAHLTESDLIDSAKTFSLGPLYGYFLTDNLELLGVLGLEYEKVEYKTTGAPLEVDYTKQTDYSLALGLQYNFSSDTEVIPFVRAFGGVKNSRREIRQLNIPLIGTVTDKRETTDPYLGMRAGIRYFIAKNISCDTGLGWQRVFYDKKFGKDTDDYSITIACAFFF